MRRGTRLACLLAAGAGAVAAMAIACNANTGSGQLAVALDSSSGPVVASSALAPPAPSTVDQIWVCITQVTAHSTSKGWVTISDPSVSSATPLCIDLLHLQNPPATLGFADLPQGEVTQIRLFVSQDPRSLPYVILTGGGRQDLTVPSGFESGIKIVGPWNIAACERLTVTLDFDAPHSIEYHATGQQPAQWILRPVILVKKTATSFVCGEDGGTDGGTQVGTDAGTDGGPTGGTDGGPV